MHANFKYKITAGNPAYRFVGRFNPEGNLKLKIPTKWSHEKEWFVESTAVEDDFVTKLFPKLVNPTWTARDKSNIVTGISGGALLAELRAICMVTKSKKP